MIKNFVFVSLACSAISTTLARSKLTAPLRDLVRKENPFVGQALSCPYCMTHWIAFFLVLLSGISLDSISQPLNFIVVWFAVVCLSVILNGIIQRLNFLHEHELERVEQILDETNAALKELIEQNEQ